MTKRGHVLRQCEYAQVDGHTRGGQVLTVLVTTVQFVKAQDEVSLDSEINCSLDKDGEEVESTCP